MQEKRQPNRKSIGNWVLFYDKIILRIMDSIMYSIAELNLDLKIETLAVWFGYIDESSIDQRRQ